MDINEIKYLATTALDATEYNTFIDKVNNNKLNSARLFLENKLDNIVFNNNHFSPSIAVFQYNSLKKLDDIITNEYINKIDVRVSK